MIAFNNYMTNGNSRQSQTLKQKGMESIGSSLKVRQPGCRRK